MAAATPSPFDDCLRGIEAVRGNAAEALLRFDPALMARVEAAMRELQQAKAGAAQLADTLKKQKALIAQKRTQLVKTRESLSQIKPKPSEARQVMEAGSEWLCDGIAHRKPPFSAKQWGHSRGDGHGGRR